jgi:hypothetical protein
MAVAVRVGLSVAGSDVRSQSRAKEEVMIREELSPVTRFIAKVLFWRHSLSFAFAAAEIATLPKLAYACAMCGLPAGDHEAHAFNASVLFMMFVPYSIILIMSAVLFFSYQAGKRRRAEELAARLEADQSKATGAAPLPVA